MITQTYNLDLIPQGVPTIISVSQYDKTLRTLQFYLFENGQEYTIPSGVRARFQGTKQDKTIFVYDMTVSTNYVSIIQQEQMATVSGDVTAEVVLYDESGTLGTANCVIRVEESAVAYAEMSTSEIETITKAVDQAQYIYDNATKIIEEGVKGEKGDKGDDGKSATITIGTTTTLPSGQDATVENVGTETDAIFNFGLPRGEQGEKGETAITVNVGTTTTLEAGQQASVTNVGTDQDLILNFAIPKGQDGSSGTLDYADLTNKPSINSVELSGNQTLTALGVASASDLTATNTQVATNVSDIANLKTDVSSNTSNITTLTSGLATANTNIESNKQTIDTVSNTASRAENGVNSLTTLVEANTENIATLQTKIKTMVSYEYVATLTSTTWADNTYTLTLTTTEIGLLGTNDTIYVTCPNDVTADEYSALGGIILTSITTTDTTHTIVLTALNGSPSVDTRIKFVSICEE